jgi:hypothetical protein
LFSFKLLRELNVILEAEPAMEVVEKCSLCGSDKQKFLFWSYDRLYRLPGKFGTLQCEQCNLIRLSPRPTVDTIGIYYPSDYGAYRNSSFLAQPDKPRLKNNLRTAVRNAVLSGLRYNTGKLHNWQKLFRPLLTKFNQSNAGLYKTF